jgi:hypothetical protein
MSARAHTALAVAIVAASAIWGATAGAHTRHRVTVAGALARLEATGAIPQATYEADLAAYNAARRSLERLTSTRQAELAAVTANVEAIAAAGLLTPSRLGVAFTTLQRNREWWTTRWLPAAGQRVSVPGSRLVWEHYPGQGIEIQWLASFGRANGYFLAHENMAMRELLDEAVALATQRAGGIAWEYMFRFDGGAPPWSSGLSQGTALQALARAWSRTHEAQYLNAAQQALGVFRSGPPAGVRVAEPAGAHYLEYTYAPDERIVNGFVQALVGLWEYAKLTGDPAGQRLFEEGDAQARVEVPHFDTGAWSMYDQHSESDLSYHELLAEFLEHLCQRTSLGEPLAPAPQPIPGDEVYCETAKRFRADLRTPPQVALTTASVRAGERAGVQIRLSKVSIVTLTVKSGEKTVWVNRATVEGGTPRLLWVTPSKPGEYGVTLKAVDLAGNEEVASGSITVRPAPKAAPKTAPKGRARKRRPKARRAALQPVSPPARRLAHL